MQEGAGTRENLVRTVRHVVRRAKIKFGGPVRASGLAPETLPAHVKAQWSAVSEASQPLGAEGTDHSRSGTSSTSIHLCCLTFH